MSLFRGACLILLCAGGFSGCATPPPASSSYLAESGGMRFTDANQLVVVDCLLPGTVQNLGGTPYVTPRRPVKTAAGACEKQGGEYTAFDRANYATALKVWQADAHAGDPAAQTHVGEIYEQGLGTEPDYQLAQAWYRKAAEQGFARAQANLGYLYEKGLGVPQDRKQALDWYRRASGLQDQLAYASQVTAARDEASGRIQALSEQLSAQTRETRSLRDTLDQARKQLDSRKADLETLRLDLQQTRKAYESLRTEPRVTPVDPAELEKLRQDVEKRELELRQAQRQVELWQQAAQRHQTQFATQFQAAEQRDLALRRELEAQQQQTASLSAQLEKSELEHYQTRQQLDKSQLELIRQQALFDAQQSEFEARQRILVQRQQQAGDQASEEIRRLQGELNASKEALDERQQIIAELEQEIRQATSRVADTGGSRLSFASGKEFIVIAREKVNFGSYHALIIGNRKYQQLTELDPVVERDARDLERLLQEQYGYQTNLLLDADRKKIYQRLRDYQEQLSERDNLLIYYAGRSRLSADGSQGYWLPVDADENNSLGNWISSQEIANQLKLMQAKHVLVVSDASYADRMTNPPPQVDVTSAMSEDAQIQRLSNLARLKVRTVLSSGGEQPQPERSGGAHSVFAGSLLEVLKNNRGILEGQTLASRISSRLQAALDKLKQAPGYYGVRDAGHLFGDYLFVPDI